MIRFSFVSIISFAIFCFLSIEANAQYSIQVIDTAQLVLGNGVDLNKTSFRGLSVVDDHIVWASGSRGTIAKSVDGGHTFYYSQLSGYTQSDFRDIEGFDANNAIIMSSGTPALILKTNDCGQTWQEVFRRNDSAYFLDAMDFWDKKSGVVVGDPIDSHFVLIQTNDGGQTWQELDSTITPMAAKNEAVFAASGTSLRCWGKSNFGFVSKNNLYLFQQFQLKSTIPLHSVIGSAAQSAGAFSFALGNNKTCIVGGDYIQDTASQHVSVFLNDDKIQPQTTSCFGYRSCAEFIGSNNLVACGTSGIDIYFNKSWQKISSQSFHVVRKAKKGDVVFLAGGKGRIAKLIH